jgi:chromate transporter
VVGLIALTAVQLALNVGRSVSSLSFGAALFVAALAPLYLWRSKLSVPVVVLGSALTGLVLFR